MTSSLRPPSCFSNSCKGTMSSPRRRRQQQRQRSPRQGSHRCRTQEKRGLCGGFSRLPWPLFRAAIAAAVSFGITTTGETMPSPIQTHRGVPQGGWHVATGQREAGVSISAFVQRVQHARSRRAKLADFDRPKPAVRRLRRDRSRTAAGDAFTAPHGSSSEARRGRGGALFARHTGARSSIRERTHLGGDRSKSSTARCALPTGEHPKIAGVGPGEARRGSRRQRSEGGGGVRRGKMYMREGIFQALPFPVRITVMGGGNFGLALSLVLARNQIPTTLLVRTEAVAEYVNTHHEHPQYLKGIKIPQHVHATADPQQALKDATYIIHAVPVQYTRKFLEKVVPYMPPTAPILSVSKGIETSSLMLMNDILKEACGSMRSYAFLSGPSFAREIAMNQATAVVIASDDTCLANDFAKVLSSPSFRCFTSKDVIGVEVGGAVKNVIALAAGMCEGLGLGTNAMAGLVTRGCGEMRRMAVILGGNSRTLSGLSGVGDTFGTCFGPLSRNRNFGIRLGKGESMEEILASSTEVAEGVDTALALADLIKEIDKSYRIDLKYAIIFGVADILKGERSPKEALEDLMTMPLRAEMYDS